MDSAEKPYIVCCICKNESRYIEEFIEYHLELGFDKIIIGDNNDLDGERYDEQLKDYVEYGEVEIVNLRGKITQQYPFYNNIIRKGDFEWCAFIDCDEFITFGEDSKFDNIKSFLRQDNTIDCYTLNWMVYGDNERVYAGEGGVLERFKKPMPLDFKFNYDFPENYHVKTILRGGVGSDYIEFINNPHCTNFALQYTPSGELLHGSPTPFMENKYYNLLYIRHFYTKSLEEWVNKKMKSRYADCLPNENYTYYPLDFYFKYNRITDAKLKYLKKHGIEYTPKL